MPTAPDTRLFCGLESVRRALHAWLLPETRAVIREAFDSIDKNRLGRDIWTGEEIRRFGQRLLSAHGVDMATWTDATWLGLLCGISPDGKAQWCDASVAERLARQILETARMELEFRLRGFLGKASPRMVSASPRPSRPSIPTIPLHIEGSPHGIASPPLHEPIIRPGVGSGIASFVAFPGAATIAGNPPECMTNGPQWAQHPFMQAPKEALSARGSIRSVVVPAEPRSASTSRPVNVDTLPTYPASAGVAGQLCRRLTASPRRQSSHPLLDTEVRSVRTSYAPRVSSPTTHPSGPHLSKTESVPKLVHPLRPDTGAAAFSPIVLPAGETGAGTGSSPCDGRALLDQELRRLREDLARTRGERNELASRVESLMTGGPNCADGMKLRKKVNFAGNFVGDGGSGACGSAGGSCEAQAEAEAVEYSVQTLMDEEQCLPDGSVLLTKMGHEVGLGPARGHDDTGTVISSQDILEPVSRTDIAASPIPEASSPQTYSPAAHSKAHDVMLADARAILADLEQDLAGPGELGASAYQQDHSGTGDSPHVLSFYRRKCLELAAQVHRRDTEVVRLRRALNETHGTARLSLSNSSLKASGKTKLEDPASALGDWMAQARGEE